MKFYGISTFQNFDNAETQKFQACFLKLKLLIYAIFIILGKQRTLQIPSFYNKNVNLCTLEGPIVDLCTLEGPTLERPRKTLRQKGLRQNGRPTSERPKL